MKSQLTKARTITAGDLSAVNAALDTARIEAQKLALADTQPVSAPLPLPLQEALEIHNQIAIALGQTPSPNPSHRELIEELSRQQMKIAESLSGLTKLFLSREEELDFFIAIHKLGEMIRALLAL